MGSPDGPGLALMVKGDTRRDLRVLLVEDSEVDAELVLRELRKGGFNPIHRCVQTHEEMSAALDEVEWEIVLSDYSMPRFSAPKALAVLRARDAELPFIIVSGTVGEDVAVQAMRLGVNDYLLKGKLGRLCAAIEREVREHESRRQGREELAQSNEQRRLAEDSLRRTEEQLRHVQKMEAIGRLAGSVAHDFNNLLSVILSYSALLLADLKPEDESRLEIEAIKRAGERAADLTRQLLAFSRKQVLDPRDLDINQVLRESERMLQRLIGEDIELTAHYAANLPLVRIDPGQIDQVVMNLAVNARDAMPDGGKLSIETQQAYIDEAYAAEHLDVIAGHYVLLSMSDTGMGIDKVTLPRIFEPFFTTKGPGKGTGLGLSTVFGIVKQSGGHIGVQSEVGQGTTMKIYLPQATPEARPSVDVFKEPTTLRGSETILVVEDQDEVRMVTLDILRRFGYCVLEAGNAGEAITHCANLSQPIHLLLTDVVMPQINGRELAAKLSQMRPDMKILYMSGYAENAIIQDGVLGADIAYLQKPLVPDALGRRVREVLDAEPRSKSATQNHRNR
ncbi:MAG TPA: response regulator [Polyangiaceae bacterium]|jgi:signal transduction histidine kinase|nr:response regulator [Polyangiaceae bacterium]